MKIQKTRSSQGNSRQALEFEKFIWETLPEISGRVVGK
jgi:hypothetical protein